MRRRGYFRRALARVTVDRTSEVRWITADKDTGRQVGMRMTYPTKRLAQAHCGPNEAPKRVTVVGNAGPFSDRIQETT